MNDIKNRSSFVTVVSWIFIILSGLATMMSFLQNVMIRIMFTDEMRNPTFKGEASEKIPETAQFMMGNFELIAMCFFLICLFTFITSIFLLKRKNWARLVFIGLMFLAVIWNLGGIFLQQMLMQDMSQINNSDIPDNFESVMRNIQIVVYTFVIGISLVFLWIIKRFCSSEVKSEFYTT